MRRALSRVAAVVAAAVSATIAMPAGPAAAASSATCPEASSIRLLTGDLVEYPDNKLWLYSPTPTQTIVCFDFSVLSLGGGAIVVNGVGLPAVTVDDDPAFCHDEIVRLTDPVPLQLSIGTAGWTVCLTVNGSTTSITFGPPGVAAPPSVEIWRDGTFSLLDAAACAAFAPGLFTGNQQPYYDCVYANARIL